jgi:hypothetical protein
MGDCAHHHKKIRSWFLNPEKYKNELIAEQKKHEGKCIYHLSDTHPTESCSIKKECDRIIAQRSNSTTSQSSGHLRNVKEDLPDDQAHEELTDMLPESDSNDTNDAELFYFVRVRNHYLRLMRSSSSIHSRHEMQYPIIADSGANFHMFREREFFESLTPASGRVILGDGTTTLDIMGVGTVRCMIGPNMLRIPNVRYVPGLAESIDSLFLHINQKDHGLQPSFDTGLLLNFPTFQTPAIVGSDDIYIDALPHVDNKIEENILPEPELVASDSVCRNVTQLDGSSKLQPKSDTNILKCLREYYSNVKTKRQLNLDVPAGFRQRTNLQRDFSEFLPPGKL